MKGTMKEILESKGHHCHSVSPDTSIAECAKIMLDADIGSLVVLDNKGNMMGMLHERQISRELVAKGINPVYVNVAEIMMTQCASATPKTSVLDAMKLVNESKVRQLPIIDEGELIGVVSIGDLTQWLIDVQEEDRQSLLHYIQGDDYTVNMRD